MIRGFLLLLWGWIVLWSVHSGRLDLLLRGVFHSLVGVSGLVLAVAGVAVVQRNLDSWDKPRWPWLAAGAMAFLVLLLPPNPSFSDLASTRPQGLPEPPDLAFVLPPEQRTLTEWVRLLRSQPDPDLVDGNPVNISGFVLSRKGQPPQIARLTVRCCLADATPAGLPVDWPQTMTPRVNQWLKIKGKMGVETHLGQRRAIVIPETITPIPRPKRPLEP
ncbi:MAG: TIGR03943 family protein [Cyanobium sp. NAT70]|nr:TIGR03943 family protein [Cyanobium sp. NAT70]|tara:strand:- start:2486 stop:3139 length:654 start_codon:yes stop_codon:yes gene_type:complete